MLPKDLLRNVSLYLSIKETALILKVNSRFNTIIGSTWKRKIMIEFGLETMYNLTWKETAKFLTKVKMINMKKKWIDGRTYEELLRDSLNYEHYFDDLRFKYSAILNCKHNPNTIEIDRDPKQKDATKYRRVITKEFSIMSRVYDIIKSTRGISTLSIEHKYSSSAFDWYGYDDPSGSPKIKLLIDPMIFVMRFSYMNMHDTLRRYVYCEDKNKKSGESIDINSMWIWDLTYKDLLDLGAQFGGEFFYNIDFHARFFYSCYHRKKCDCTYLEQYINKLQRDLEENKYEEYIAMNIKKKVITHEFKVIALAVIDREGIHARESQNFFGQKLADDKKSMNNEISRLIDPMFYVMSYESINKVHVNNLFEDVMANHKKCSQ
uniref:F-box domain-containing protein n=1 Tax=Pithovirus LCPAC403 TaxID=2506596 RepID=A0A481ZD05_9VIRU|nr:MAG: uncharacterized protein LCPAC403_03460 [Pithovirus LCPAC403]